ncbi:hypothetical protein B9Z55_026009 [Caenorhabditis nigoni]|uniref:Uncharacterized protein n=1 Tax=Caenorhabditis nigoni TaxID=1611254 RepID=A0A2G5T169_9PELO|nr:hypothetical protein B9Z55_026009 [Caenorhabditis nigoni]
MSETTQKDKEKDSGGDATYPTDPDNPPPFFTSATIMTKHRKALNGCSIKPSWRKTEEDMNKDQLAVVIGNKFFYVYRTTSTLPQVSQHLAAQREKFPVAISVLCDLWIREIHRIQWRLIKTPCQWKLTRLAQKSFTTPTTFFRMLK